MGRVMKAALLISHLALLVAFVQCLASSDDGAVNRARTRRPPRRPRTDSPAPTGRPTPTRRPRPRFPRGRKSNDYEDQYADEEANTPAGAKELGFEIETKEDGQKIIKKLIDKLKEMNKFLSDLVTSWDIEAGAEVEEPAEGEELTKVEEETEAPAEEGAETAEGEEEEELGIAGEETENEDEDTGPLSCRMAISSKVRVGVFLYFICERKCREPCIALSIRTT